MKAGWLMQEPLAAVIEGVKKVLEITPPELAADIVNNGIVMTRRRFIGWSGYTSFQNQFTCSYR